MNSVAPIIAGAFRGACYPTVSAGEGPAVAAKGFNWLTVPSGFSVEENVEKLGLNSELALCRVVRKPALPEASPTVAGWVWTALVEGLNGLFEHVAKGFVSIALVALFVISEVWSPVAWSGLLLRFYLI